MHDFGAARDHLANVALAARRHANGNPAAVMGTKPMTREDYTAARWISEPLCLFDNCLETDGASAVVITSTEHASTLAQPPAILHAWAQSLPAQHDDDQLLLRRPPAGPGLGMYGEAVVARGRGPRRGRRGPALRRLQPPLVLLSLEGYGFCERGEAGPFTDDGGIEVGGRVVEHVGRDMSEAYLHGFNLIVEAVRQIRGASTNQVEGAGDPLCTSGEGVPTGALLFRADR